MIGNTRIALAGMAMMSLGGCALVGLHNAPLHPKAQAQAAPPALAPFGGDGPVRDFAHWQDMRAPLLRAVFGESIYGAYPAPMDVHVLARELIAPDAYEGLGRIEQWEIGLGEDPGAPRLRFHLALVLPKAAKGPVPIVLMENFCGNGAALRNFAGIIGPRCKTTWFSRLRETAIFGSRIFAPPFHQVLQRGYGIAALHAGEVVPDRDNPQTFATLEALTPPGTPPAQRTGAILAWAWTFSRAYEALQTDPRIDGAHVALWGHSRHGKAALAAAAFDPRLPAVIALQSGTGGASLGRDDVGESTEQITTAYPHWFAPAYRAYSGHHGDLPVDQHQLIALIAPRPVLIGGARRDVWGDPNGALAALHGADPVYRLAGAPPFEQTDPRKPEMDKPLAYFWRPGFHGVHQSDWDRALDFLDAQWGQPQKNN